jgi:hypothetical protein
VLPLDDGDAMGYMPPVNARTFFCSLLCLFALAAPRAAWSDEEDQLRLPASTSTTADKPPAPEPAAASAAPLTAGDPADAAEQAIKGALATLATVEVALARTSSSDTRSELVALRDQLLGALVALGQLRQDRDTRVWLQDNGYALVRGGDPVAASKPVRPGTTGVAPLSTAEANQLRRDISNAPFNEGKLQTLRAGIEGRTLTALQAEELLELFSFSRDRVDVLVYIHPRLARPEEFKRLLSALKFESDRQAVRDRLGLGT